ncbi:hypothetical protein MNQ98_23365 [Paenibacillus sp. N3/727]|uniref:hypothetical protein n=1 Tax=Paenibacillus sp. N3/727 TaxID=2925845 RepID=UPI001F530086|nr:hypothetical protein [Paenibacillus sp. N3/727]UNK17387.1 hypothetical protein MNQ98_23365 [Paenibacillus sp. N3/727]
MRMLVYNGPIGEPVENPSEDSDYWLQGSGDSCLEVEGLEERLVFFMDEPFGF